jgi:hypothetical protein
MAKRKTRLGRPPKHAAERKSKYIHVRLTESQHEAIARKSNGLPLSAYLREKALS